MTTSPVKPVEPSAGALGLLLGWLDGIRGRTQIAPIWRVAGVAEV